MGTPFVLCGLKRYRREFGIFFREGRNKVTRSHLRLADFDVADDKFKCFVTKNIIIMDNVFINASGARLFING
jgi:hypothetical protein